MTDFNEVIQENLSNHYNVRDEFKDNTVEENREICRQDSLGFAVGALSITGELNIGIMIRTASLLGAERFFIFGRRKYDRRSTVGAHKYIDIEKYEEPTYKSIAKVWKKYDNQYLPVLVDQIPSGYGTVSLSNMNEKIRETEKEIQGRVDGYVAKPLFIFGSESEGIPQHLIHSFSYPSTLQAVFVQIPQRGVLRSLNVSSAMSMVTWEYTRLLIDTE